MSESFAPFSWRHMPAAQQKCGIEVMRILPRGRVTCRVQEGIQSLVAPIQCTFFCTQRGLGFATAKLCGLFAAPRTSHPQREFLERRLPAYTIVQVPVAESHGTRRTYTPHA